MSGAPEKKKTDDIPEIEVTPEMAEAGIEALKIWDNGDLPEWKVIDVYRQMERARLRSKADQAIQSHHLANISRKLNKVFGSTLGPLIAKDLRRLK